MKFFVERTSLMARRRCAERIFGVTKKNNNALEVIFFCILGFVELDMSFQMVSELTSGTRETSGMPLICCSFMRDLRPARTSLRKTRVHIFSGGR